MLFYEIEISRTVKIVSDGVKSWWKANGINFIDVREVLRMLFLLIIRQNPPPLVSYNDKTSRN